MHTLILLQQCFAVLGKQLPTTFSFSKTEVQLPSLSPYGTLSFLEILKQVIHQNLVGTVKCAAALVIIRSWFWSPYGDVYGKPADVHKENQLERPVCLALVPGMFNIDGP